MHHQHIVYIYIYFRDDDNSGHKFYSDATGLSVYWHPFTKKKNGSNHVRIAKIYITCSSLFDQTSKKTHVSVIHVKNGNLNHTNVHNFLFPFSRLNVYAVWVHLASYIWKSCLRVKTPCCIVSSYPLMRVEAIWIQCGKGGPPPH